jgi:Tfp pilus assembly protein PilF
MKCPACDEKITDGAWMCPFCEHIVDASFLGNDITNEAGWADGLEDVATFDSLPPAKPAPRRKTRELELAPEPPTDGLDVEAQMIVSAYEDELEGLEMPDRQDDLPVVREVRDLGAPKHTEDKIDTKPLPDDLLPSSVKPLDPSLLQEIGVVQPAPMVIDSKKRGLPAPKKSDPGDDSEQKKREVLARAMARGPVQERRRSVADGEKPPTPKPAVSSPAPISKPMTPLAGIPQVKTEPKGREVDVVIRNAKAEKIFQQALEDLELGNVISARTNIKLALSFDPGNERYRAKLAEVESEAGPSHSQDLEEVPKGAQHAKQFYEKAIEQENQGSFDEAIRLLEKAVRADPQGVYYHRLGSILAFHQGKLKEGRTMVDKAIQRSPKNKNYQKTLSRILEKMGDGNDRRNMADLLGGLLKRK